MSDIILPGLSRRDLLKTAGGVAAASTLAQMTIPHVHAGEDNTIQVALVGCGGRGAGAAVNALSVPNGPTKLVAMADVFPQKLASAYQALKGEHADKVDVPEDRKFVSFDGYKHAMDSLRPGDVVILATPPAFRWPHFRYAIDKGLNVFMEKPTTVDGPSTRKMLALAEESEKKNLKVGVGLMCRHCAARGEMYERIKQGEIGDIVLMRAYRLAGPTAHAFAGPKPSDMSELLYQIQEFHAFLWASGGAYSDFLIHNIDECCWMKDAWPIEAKSVGGRHFRGDYVDQNFDSYATEYTFADGSKFYMEGRLIPDCHDEFASYAHGSKGSAIISTAGHAPSRARLFNSQKMTKEHQIWRYGSREPNPYQLEWDHLIQAIRDDKPYNEARRGAEASHVTNMGRMSAHTGQVITWDQMLNSDHEFAPQVAELTMDSQAPIQAGPDGRYPVPLPGITKTREF